MDGTGDGRRTPPPGAGALGEIISAVGRLADETAMRLRRGARFPRGARGAPISSRRCAGRRTRSRMSCAGCGSRLRSAWGDGRPRDPQRRGGRGRHRVAVRGIRSSRPPRTGPGSRRRALPTRGRPDRRRAAHRDGLRRVACPVPGLPLHAARRQGALDQRTAHDLAVVYEAIELRAEREAARAGGPRRRRTARPPAGPDRAGEPRHRTARGLGRMVAGCLVGGRPRRAGRDARDDGRCRLRRRRSQSRSRRVRPVSPAPSAATGSASSQRVRG